MLLLRSETFFSAIVAVTVLVSAGCNTQSSAPDSGRKFSVIKLNFATFKTAEQASAFFGSQPIRQDGDSATWQVQDGLTMTFQVGEQGFARLGAETHPLPTFDPPIENAEQAKTAFGREPDRTVSNATLEMSIESYEVDQRYEISFGFKTDGTVSVLFGGSEAAKAAVDQVPAPIVETPVPVAE